MTDKVRVYVMWYRKGSGNLPDLYTTDVEAVSRAADMYPNNYITTIEVAPEIWHSVTAKDSKSLLPTTESLATQDMYRWILYNEYENPFRNNPLLDSVKDLCNYFHITKERFKQFIESRGDDE